MQRKPTSILNTIKREKNAESMEILEYWLIAGAVKIYVFLDWKEYTSLGKQALTNDRYNCSRGAIDFGLLHKLLKVRLFDASSYQLAKC